MSKTTARQRGSCRTSIVGSASTVYGLRSRPAAGKAKELFPFCCFKALCHQCARPQKSIFFSKLLARALSPLKALSDACYWGAETIWELSKFIQKMPGPTSASALPSIQSAGGAPVILFSEHKKKKIFLFRRHAKWHGKQHTDHMRREK